MNLTIDIGNTRNKLAIFNKDELIDYITLDQLSQENINSFIAKRNIDQAILSSVKETDQDLIKYLKSRFSNFIELSKNTPIPIENLYKSKSTLGKDRLAAVVGANNIFPDTNVLVIDMGTALTFDFVNDKNQYLGGNISPGLQMRFKSLNHFTGKLPLLSKEENFKLIGDNTKNAIISGVQNGIIFEINSYITQLKKEKNDLKTILTGGDAIFFDKILKNTIFVDLNLNLKGLNIILEHNKSR